METTELRKQNQSPANKLHQYIENFSFVDVGNISKVYTNGLRVDVTLSHKDENDEHLELKGIELLRIGTKNVSITIEPQVGDCVLLLCPKSLVIKQEFNRKPTNEDYDPYGTVNIKALQLQPNEIDDNASITIRIDKDSKLALKAKEVELETSDVSIDASKISISTSEFNVNDHFKVTK